jgi:hypothetical protein
MGARMRACAALDFAGVFPDACFFMLYRAVAFIDLQGQSSAKSRSSSLFFKAVALARPRLIDRLGVKCRRATKNYSAPIQYVINSELFEACYIAWFVGFVNLRIFTGR